MVERRNRRRRLGSLRLVASSGSRLGWAWLVAGGVVALELAGRSDLWCLLFAFLLRLALCPAAPLLSRCCPARSGDLGESVGIFFSFLFFRFRPPFRRGSLMRCRARAGRRQCAAERGASAVSASKARASMATCSCDFTTASAAGKKRGEWLEWLEVPASYRCVAHEWWVVSVVLLLLHK